jgi:hypothetical protein
VGNSKEDTMHGTVIAAVALVAGVAIVTAATTTASPAAAEPRAAAGSLDFEAGQSLISTSVPCPVDVPANTTECRAHTLVGSLIAFPGRNWGSETTYTLPLAMGPPTCPAGLSKPLATTGRFSVAVAVDVGVFARIGEITFTLAEGARCVGVESAWTVPQEFTITGGTGAFAGAAGSGKVERGLDDFWGTDAWFETWTGTLAAPGLHFTLPKLTGAVAKTVRAAKGAKSARVTFEVKATDSGGGAIPVSCSPSSGSRFPLGPTIVLCAATDASGNTATTVFAVTVKRGR